MNKTRIIILISIVLIVIGVLWGISYSSKRKFINQYIGGDNDEYVGTWKYSKNDYNKYLALYSNYTCFYEYKTSFNGQLLWMYYPREECYYKIEDEILYVYILNLKTKSVKQEYAGYLKDEDDLYFEGLDLKKY